MVDHQNVFFARGWLTQKPRIAISGFCHQFGGPGFSESRAIDLLMFFCACREIGSAGRPFVVNNFT